MLTYLKVGQTVQLADGRVGIVRYVGQTEFADGDWVGVELDSFDGKNDGSVQGQRYFECEPARGMFLRPSAAVVIQQAPAPAPRANGAATKKPARPSSVGGPGLGRRLSTVPDAGAGKRMSINAASPSPVTRSRPSSMLRVGHSFYNSRQLLIVA